MQTDPVRYDSDIDVYTYVGNDPTDKTDPSGLESVGEMIDSAAEGCGAISCAGWAALSATWQVFGAEGVSQLADKGWSGASSGDRASAGLEIASVLPPVKAVSAIADAAKAGEAVAKTSKIDRAAFNAERKAFWKSEAKNNPDKYAKADMAKMEKGKPPTGSDGHPMELHHKDGTPGGGVEPMTRTDHRLGENFKKNHWW